MGTLTPLVELRVRSVVPAAEMVAKVGKVAAPGDWNVQLVGPCRVLAPNGTTLAVYLPGHLRAEMDAQVDRLSGIRLITDNRGQASGSTRERRGAQQRTRTRRIISGTLGAVDPGPSTGRAVGRLPVCRLTAWTGRHLPDWQALQPLLQGIDRALHDYVPDRWQAQARAARDTEPDWLVPGTTFTTVTLNNTYSTGQHKDSGDLEAGFSTLAVARRGAYRGGLLVLGGYRIAVDMAHGDLLLFDAHTWHGNSAIHCPHQADGADQLARPCPEGCERISLVAYYRTKVGRCGTADAEAAKALAHVPRPAATSGAYPE
jgi:hypothetical protein